jgi:hypothetical protein
MKLNKEMTDFAVNHNLSLYNSGGGHMTITNNWDCGKFFWMITDMDGELPLTVNDVVCVGLYDNDSGDMIAWWEQPDMIQAVVFMKKTHLI